MQIQKQLPRFEGKKVLILVLGRQYGVFYFVSGGQIEKIGFLEEPTPRYSDNEGFFMRRGRGEIYGAGAVREPKTNEAKKKFLKKVCEELKKTVKEKNITGIYIFEPDYLKNDFGDKMYGYLKKNNPPAF